MTEMNDLAKRWVAALRSGKYKQGKLVLRNPDNRFCCLGVLADVYNPTLWSTETRVVHNKCGDQIYTNFGYAFAEDNVEVLSPELWALVTEGSSHQFAMSTLADANDGGLTFEQIIEDYILPMWEEKESNHD